MTFAIETYFSATTHVWLIIMKQGLLKILRDIFSSSGYNVTESYQYDMVAEKNGYKTLIKLGAYPDSADIKNFAEHATDGMGLYVATHKMESDLYQYATNCGLIVWDRDDVALQIGKAVLADIEGTTADLELIPPVDQQASTQTNNTGFGDDSLFGMFGQSDATKKTPASPEPEPISTTPQPNWSGNVFAQPEPVQSPPAEPSPPMVLNLHAVPLNVSREQAINIAKQHIGIVSDVSLKFVPFWRYEYSINVEQQYKSKIIDISGDGVGCLNALNGNNEVLELKEIYDSIEVPDETYEVKGPILTRDEANSDLLKNIIEQHTEDIRFDAMSGDTIISEHKRFKPSAEDVNLEIEMVYLPIWELNGRKSSVEISGYNAEVLCNPVDEDVEFM